MRNDSLFTDKSRKIRYGFLILVILFGLTGCRGDLDSTKVQVTISPQELREGDTANVEALLTSGPPNNTPIPMHRSIKFDLDVTTAGGLNATTKATDPQGVAKVVFTAVKVDVDTPVTITATSRNGSGSNDNELLTVRPPIIFGDFGGDGPGISINNADVIITPSVNEPETNEYHFTYTVTSSASPTEIDHLVLSFAVPMESVGSTASVRDLGNNTFSIGVVLDNPVTITAICKDCKTGGTTNFVIFDGPLPANPGDPTPELINKNAIGPKPN